MTWSDDLWRFACGDVFSFNCAGVRAYFQFKPCFYDFHNLDIWLDILKDYVIFQIFTLSAKTQRLRLEAAAANLGRSHQLFELLFCFLFCCTRRADLPDKHQKTDLQKWSGIASNKLIAISTQTHDRLSGRNQYKSKQIDYLSQVVSLPSCISSKLYLSQQSSDVMGGIIWQSVVLRGNKKQPRCDRDWMLSARGNWSLRLLGAGKKDKYAAGNSRGKRKIRGGHWSSKQNQIQMKKYHTQ